MCGMLLACTCHGRMLWMMNRFGFQLWCSSLMTNSSSLPVEGFYGGFLDSSLPSEWRSKARAMWGIVHLSWACGCHGYIVLWGHVKRLSMAKQRGRRHFGDDSQWKHGNDSQVPSSCGSDQKPKFHSQEQVGRFVYSVHQILYSRKNTRYFWLFCIVHGFIWPHTPLWGGNLNHRSMNQSEGCREYGCRCFFPLCWKTLKETLQLPDV
jgi:hypothetical protein